MNSLGWTCQRFLFLASSRGRQAMVRKGGFEPPCLSAPPPQDGVSANSTTSARFRLIITKPSLPIEEVKPRAIKVLQRQNRFLDSAEPHVNERFCSARNDKVGVNQSFPNTSQSPQTTSGPDWPRPPGPHRFLLRPSAPARFPALLNPHRESAGSRRSPRRKSWPLLHESPSGLQTRFAASRFYPSQSPTPARKPPPACPPSW